MLRTLIKIQEDTHPLHKEYSDGYSDFSNKCIFIQLQCTQIEHDFFVRCSVR